MLNWIADQFGAKSFTVFVSHSFDDADWLDDYLAGVVSNLGADYIMAEHDFALSTEGSISKKVARMIDTSDAILVLLSKKGNASKFVQQEIGYAHKAGKPIIALIQKIGKKVEKPGFLFDKDVIAYKGSADLKNLREDLKKIIEYAWDKKRGAIKQGIIIAGIIFGLSLLSPDDDCDEDDYI